MDSAKDAGMVEAVAKSEAAKVAAMAIARHHFSDADIDRSDQMPLWFSYLGEASVAVAAALPLIEAQVIERCAKIADRVAAECADDARNLRLAGDSQGGVDAAAGARVEAGRIARMIRALALSPAGDAGGGEK